jgi:formylglycine-generating enzyme required for sulfatase activity
MDDNFLRQVAALQANLKMLESQSASLTDQADMKELRQFKVRLADYIDGHAAAGNLPRDPFQVIEGRLRALEDFFSATTRETNRLTSWRRDWLKAAPSVDLATLQGAHEELHAMEAEVQRIQESLRTKISPLDWAVGSHAAELHQGLLVCASCVPGLELQKQPRRQAAYDFAHGSGTVAEDVAKHFRAVGAKIREWMSLHATHASELSQIAQDLENQQIRSAERRWESLGRERFNDLNYASAEAGVDKLQAILRSFTRCSATLSDRVDKGKISSINLELREFARSITKRDSELGRESLRILNEMQSFVEKELKDQANERSINFITTSISAMACIIAILAVWLSSSSVTPFVSGSVAFASAVIGIIGRNRRNRARHERRRERDALEFEIAPGVKMTFRWCPSGKFMMGSPHTEKDRGGNEGQMEVTLSEGFWMAKTQVTQAQWEAVMERNPSKFKGGNRPVENVSWRDAQDFLDKLNARLGRSDGGKMVLPTEAQWEYVARADQAEIYAGGSLDEVAWYSGNSGGETHPVAMKKANAWGLHDMSGNVWEWCQDWYGAELSGGTNPVGPSSGTSRVIRGGSWASVAFGCRVADRYDYDPAGTGSGIGFRIVRSSVP